MKVYEFVVRDYKKEKAKKVLNEAKTTMTTLMQLLIKIDPDSKGILTPTILETIDMWLSWWERDALAHLRGVQKKGLDSAAAMGRLHQIQEIRIGLTVDKEKFDSKL